MYFCDESGYSSTRTGTYLFRQPSSIRKWNLKTLSRNSEEIGLDDFNDEGRIFWGVGSGVGAVVALIFFGYGTFTAELVPYFWGSGITAASAPGLYQFVDRLTQKKRVRRIRKKVNHREFSIALTSGSYEKMTSSSRAMTALLATTYGKSLEQEIRSMRITQRKDLASRMSQLESNPDNKLFPKLKPVLDEYLAKTVNIDISLETGKIKDSDKVESAKTALKKAAELVATKMQQIADEHQAELDEVAALVAAQAEMEQSCAETELQGYIAELEAQNELALPFKLSLEDK